MANIERRSSVCNMKNTSWAFHWQHVAPPHVPREFTRAQLLVFKVCVCLSVTVWWVGCRRCLVSHNYSQLTIASPADPLVGDLYRFQSRHGNKRNNSVHYHGETQAGHQHDTSWDYQGTQVFGDRTAGFAVLHEGVCCWNCLEGCCGALKLG